MSDNSTYNLIIADDDRTVRNLLSLKASHYGFSPITAENGKQALELIQDSVDVILLDLHMPEMDGFQCLETLAKKHPQIPVIILSGETDAEAAMKAVKLGAHDYLTKPFDLDELFTALRNAKKLSRIQRENKDLKDSAAPSPAATDIISTSAKMQKILSQAQKVAQLNSSILLTGESGTGKGVLARYIHAQSARAHMPFITVSCPALPRELLESELFGHEKGAFTGAINKRIGKVEAAKGGTLFLDEIGELPIDLQPKLLNLLQDREFQRIGGSKTITSDIRIITATNIDFEASISSGAFRKDLYYRISVIPLELPSLKERPDEILPLAKHFLDRVSKQRDQQPITISPCATEALLKYNWPGNVRQLENLIERASAFCDDNTITAADLSGDISEHNEDSHLVTGLAGQTLAEIEKSAILQTLALCSGNKAKTARKLGITEKSIYNKMKRHGL